MGEIGVFRAGRNYWDIENYSMVSWWMGFEWWIVWAIWENFECFQKYQSEGTQNIETL